ncbi:hypothetical protein ACKS0A_08523 [Histoplasma ohiense]
MSVGSVPFLSLFLLCSTNTENVVVSPSLPNCCWATCTSFCNSRTAYSNVVRVSSTSSTINTFFPIRFAISSELRSSHCVRVTFVPSCSIWSSFPRFSYSDKPMAWMGMFAPPGCLRKDLRILAGIYPPPPMAIMRFGLKSLRMRSAES